jgi:hypothetical protein
MAASIGFQAVTTEEVLHKINTDPDFVFIKRFDYSLVKLLERFPDGAPDHTVAKALMITPEDVEKLYRVVVEKLRASLVQE